MQPILCWEPKCCATGLPSLQNKTSPIAIKNELNHVCLFFLWFSPSSGDLFNLRTSKTTCSNSVKVAQLHGKTSDLATLLCNATQSKDIWGRILYQWEFTLWAGLHGTHTSELLVVRTQTGRHHLISFFSTWLGQTNAMQSRYEENSKCLEKAVPNLDVF